MSAPDNIPKTSIWTNEEKVKLIRLRLQGLTFEEIGSKLSRTKHAARSEYGRIRRGETGVTVKLNEVPELLDATIQLKEVPELLKMLPTRKKKEETASDDEDI